MTTLIVSIILSILILMCSLHTTGGAITNPFTFTKCFVTEYNKKYSGSKDFPIRISNVTFSKTSTIVRIRSGHVQFNEAVPSFHISPAQSRFLISTLVNGLLALLLTMKQQRSLTSAGLMHSMALGIGLWTFLDIRGWSLGVTFLILGSIATKIKILEKETLGIAEKRGGARAPENVWGSAAAAMLCAIGAYMLPKWSETFMVGFVASFATKLGDTLSSEIGKAYGKTTYLITSWAKVPRGTEGAVSLEGTVAGICGGMFMALLAYELDVIQSFSGVAAVIIASIVATTIESVIGAVFQDSIMWLSNELVNLIMTFIGAVVGIAFFRIMM